MRTVLYFVEIVMNTIQIDNMEMPPEQNAQDFKPNNEYLLMC